MVILEDSEDAESGQKYLDSLALKPAAHPSTFIRALLLHTLLLLSEGSIAVMAMAIHMKGDTSLAVFFSNGPGMFFLVASAALLISGAVILSQYLESKRSSTSYFGLVVTMNVIIVMLTLIIGEMALQVGSSISIEGLGTRTHNVDAEKFLRSISVVI